MLTNKKFICHCGSGKEARELYDAREIFVGFVCDDCIEKKKSQYRSEIFTDCNYDLYGEELCED